jgi:MFS transporter, FHS family, L-fucose permease
MAGGVGHSSVNNNTTFDSNKNYNGALGVLTALFFMWGFITCLNDILIPALKDAFDLNNVQSMLINTCFFGAFFIMAIPSGKIIEKIGYKKGIIVGLITMLIGCSLFYPAAEMKVYGLFLGALFILASGITVLQVAANPYVAILGKPELASSRLNLTQAINSLGTTLAPIFGSAVIFKAVGEHVSAQDVEMPYLGLATTLGILAFLISLAKLPVITHESNDEAQDLSQGASFKYSHLALGVFAIFMYVGGEVTIGSLLSEYIALESVLNIPLKEAAGYVSYYWMGAMIGRFIGAALMTKINPGKALGFAGIINVLLIIISTQTTGWTSMIAMVSIGLFNSIMFPTIFTLAISKLGNLTSQGASYLVMAIVGGAIIPLFVGYVADLYVPEGLVGEAKEAFKNEGLKVAYLVPIICYAYIAYYGFSGSKVKKSNVSKSVSKLEEFGKPEVLNQ